MLPHYRLPLPLFLLFLVTLTSLTPLTHAAESLPAGVDITEDTPGQVTINGDPTGNTTLGPHIPITATLFSGVPGPSACRGHVILHLALGSLTTGGSSPDGGGQGEATAPQAETCYDLSGTSSSSGGGGAGCGVFTASKEAGCEARLFAEPRCRVYVNTAVFIQEERAVGGRWRSLGVRCGVPAPDEASLGKPPLAGLMSSAMVVKKPGRVRRRGG
ncbi:uncharacterized protein C8A04DRAFT_10471 [Dichotomopilus funicola]|uniref:Uncharacterized protein n=1 Tax=Dichotomopilus funicola TaxID=1934379 RepID=A0AAN6ZPW5_9PEZI|nr:hypothetical protein C8A04DRAFT_10471 [Dichotomopilus funicola]